MPKRRVSDRKIWTFEEKLVRKAHEFIWEHPIDRFYTDHGEGHSERVCNFAERLARFYESSGYELHLLRQAAYLHDIGMQFDFWGAQAGRERSTIAEELDFPAPPLGAEEVRRRHVALGEKLVSEDIAGRRKWSVIPPFCSETSDARNALHHARLVAFAHSNGATWDSFHKPNATLNQRPDRFDEPLRLRLLAGLFRLADELDGNRRRVPRIDQLFSLDLTDESRKHWLACFFVDSVTLEPGVDKGIKVRVHWRIPVEADSRVREAIQGFLLDWRLRRITATVADIDTMYRAGGEGGFVRSVEVMGLQDEPTDFPMDVDDRLRSLLGIEAIEAPAPQTLLTLGDGKGGHKRSDDEQGEIDESDLELKDWFYSNHQLGHFMLAGGLHTDTLVQCRTWISNRQLLAAVSSRIIAELSSRGRPDVIVGVGTSALPVAVETALRLGCRVTFTFGEPPLQAADEIPRHPLWEVRPVLDGSEEHILIIDDIISFGITARHVIETLQEIVHLRSGKKPLISHCALLRLGSEELTEVSGVYYFYLCSLPGVRYRRSEDTCEQCQDGHPLIREWDL